jgi:AsmA family protein
VRGDRPHPINCLVGNFDVQRGVATAKTFILDTTDTVVEGQGNVNLGDETIYLDLKPHPKDWSPLSLRTPIQVRGTLGEPQVKPHAGGLAARLGAAVGLAIVAPPAALLPLIETGLGEQNMCSRAFAAAEGSSSQQTRDKAKENAQPPQPQKAPAPQQGGGRRQ